MKREIEKMDYIECLMWLGKQTDGKKAIELIREISGLRNSSHSRMYWHALDRIWAAHCPKLDQVPYKEFFK